MDIATEDRSYLLRCSLLNSFYNVFIFCTCLSFLVSDAPLDFRIKSNLVADLLSLAGKLNTHYIVICYILLCIYYMRMLLYIRSNVPCFCIRITYYILLCSYSILLCVYSILLLFMSLCKYSTAQFKLDIYTCITLVLLDKFVRSLMSFM